MRCCAQNRSSEYIIHEVHMYIRDKDLIFSPYGNDRGVYTKNILCVSWLQLTTYTCDYLSGYHFEEPSRVYHSYLFVQQSKIDF